MAPTQKPFRRFPWSQLTVTLRMGVCWTLLLLAPTLFAGNVTVSGYVSDANSGESLPNASVYDANTGKGVACNTFGFYSLTLPSGEVDLRYAYVGYRQQTIRLTLEKDTTLVVRLIPSTELREVTIRSGSPRKEFGVLGAQMGAIQVPIAQIKSIPALFGETDVLKALQLLPGVQGGTEGSAGLYVRGGGPEENLLLLDGVPVYNVNHLFGFFSVFNADALKNVTLYKGNFPARFSGRLSSVVDLQMKDGDSKKVHGNASIGLVSSKFNLEGPLFNGKTTFNTSFRRTYADLLLQPALWAAEAKNASDDRTTAGYYFYDVNVKISHTLSDNDKLYWSWYSGDDIIYFKYSDNYSESGVQTKGNVYTHWNWGNLVSSMRWNHVVSSKLFMNTTASYTQYRFNMKVGEDFQYEANSSDKVSESFEAGYRSGIRDYALRTEFDYSPVPGHDIKFGGNLVRHVFRPDVTALHIQVTGTGSYGYDTLVGDGDLLSTECNLYAEDNLSLGSFLKANVGLNYSHFAVQGRHYQSLEPRLSLRALLTNQLSFKAGYASMSQYVHLLSNSNLSMPTDLWVPTTKRILPMTSTLWSAGLFYAPTELLDLSLEGYYKHRNNIIEYKDGAGFGASSTGWEDKVSMGEGWSYGVEFLAQKTIGATTGWIGYTWSKAEHRFNKPGQEINQGKTFPAKYDRRHDISLTLNHRFSERFDLSGTWVYCTGNTGTLALSRYRSATIPEWSRNTSSEPLEYVSERNNYRMPSYHRMDIGFNFHKQKKHGIRTWSLSVYNAYCRLNPFVVYEGTSSERVYNPQTNTWDNKKTLKLLSLFPLIPSLSYSYKF
jgi:outer membrane receptor for ferrienterochelin and colicin